jgi:hypothetical protein
VPQPWPLPNLFRFKEIYDALVPNRSHQKWRALLWRAKLHLSLRSFGRKECRLNPSVHWDQSQWWRARQLLETLEFKCELQPITLTGPPQARIARYAVLVLLDNHCVSYIPGVCYAVVIFNE